MCYNRHRRRTREGFTACGSGGTGRRARLRGVWSIPYGFKSRLPHFFFFYFPERDLNGPAMNDGPGDRQNRPRPSPQARIQVPSSAFFFFSFSGKGLERLTRARRREFKSRLPHFFLHANACFFLSLPPLRGLPAVRAGNRKLHAEKTGTSCLGERTCRRRACPNSAETCRAKASSSFARGGPPQNFFKNLFQTFTKQAPCSVYTHGNGNFRGDPPEIMIKIPAKGARDARRI